jgi:hypothetical protein
VSVDAGQNEDNFADANVLGVGTGIVASGTVGASTTVSGAVRAKMDGVITGGGALTVQGRWRQRGDADAFVGGLGAVTISGGAALGFITSTADVEATLASTASIHVTGAILVTALSDNDAECRYGHRRRRRCDIWKVGHDGNPRRRNQSAVRW